MLSESVAGYVRIAQTNAAAKNWQSVLKRNKWRSLQLNIAHFGDFDNNPSSSACSVSDTSYEAQATSLIMKYDNVYVDLGYWTDVTGSNRIKSTNPNHNSPVVLDLLADQLARTDKLKRRLMYGSDWSMIGRVEQHNSYLVDIQNALRSARLKLNETERLAIFGGNAIRYLGLDRKGKQYTRLKKHFGDAPQYQAIMDLIQPEAPLITELRTLFEN